MLTKWYIDFFKWQLHVLSIEMLFSKLKSNYFELIIYFNVIFVRYTCIELKLRFQCIH